MFLFLATLCAQADTVRALVQVDGEQLRVRDAWIVPGAAIPSLPGPV